MPWQFCKHIRRNFQPLFLSMERHYRESERLRAKILAQDPRNPEDFDQQLWNDEKSASRASFIMGMAAIEAFANSLLSDFAVHDKSQIPPVMISKHLSKTRIDRWPLAEKIYFLPTLCNRPISPPATFFDRQSRDFRLFEELIEITNSIMHGRPTVIMLLAHLSHSKLHTMIDEFDQNFWPISEIPRDFTSFNQQCAEAAFHTLTWVRDSLITHVGGLDRQYLGEERMRLISRVFREDEVSRESLLKDWKDFVLPGEGGRSV
jgi:hypothetical protein